MMNKMSEKQNTVRKYLLGELDDETEMRRLEENILLNEGFAEQLAIGEDELIDDYLDGTLTGRERERFVQFFLSSPQIKEKLRLIRNLRKYAAKQASTQTIRQFSEKETVSRFDWRKLFSPVSLKFAVIVLLVAGFGFGIWRAAFYQSNVDRGLAQLRLAYRGQRPTQARTTANFDYAQLTETRGNAPASGDERALKHAELLFYEAIGNSSDAEAHQALGLLFLADRKFDRALDEFNLALKIAPDNARLQGDLGAALLEAGKKAKREENGAKSFELFNQSLVHLEKAIALNPKLLEPKFNRALCLQALPSPEQAKQAWREYLELDADSQWAEEARRNLQNLESQESKERSADELERDFLAAFGQKNNDEAWLLLSRNRELIREKYLPQRLAMSFLKASGNEKQTLLQALQYAGELEINRNGDPFASEVARFYTTLPDAKVELLKQAQSSMQNGYKLSLDYKFEPALNEFTRARNLFVQGSDAWEAKLSEYSIGYCLININRINEGIVQLDRVVEFSQKRNYKWLEVTSLYWLAGGFSSLKQQTQSKKISEKALALAEEIKDSYAIQRNLLELARHSSFVGQKQSALDYLRRVLEKSNDPETSLRQKYRNYADALQILTAAKLYSAAKPIAIEAVLLADWLADRMFETRSRNNAAVACVHTGDFAQARAWLNVGREKAEMIDDESSRKRMIAYFFLESGYLERQAGDYEKSKQFYDEAVGLYETMEMPSKLYEAQKGRLLTYLALGQNAELEEQISVTRKLTDDYREKILEEQERTSFFDTEESVYDIAVGYKFGRGEYEQAYNYAEASSSRSLLDWLQKGARISGDKKKVKIWLEENASPLTLSEIRERMPDNVQILQYSVLDDKVLIWLVSKEKFVVVPSPIRSVELSKKVENYVELLKRKDDNAQSKARQIARELYDLLINPIVGQLNPAQEICLIPSKVLFSLPFAAVISPSEKPLLVDFNIFYAPSANVFLYCTENARQKDNSINETLLSIGNPAFDDQIFDKLPDLPTAEKEAREIAALYDEPKTFFGHDATKKALENSIKDADIIHFAGHYVIVPEEPLSSYLLLAQNGKNPEDSILTNSELVDKKLPRAKLVVLSACQTGVEQYYNGEGLIGLSRTFLAAGAPLVVASGWSVDTEATAELMKRFHFYRRQEKMTTTVALRNAQLEMLNAPDGRFREPYYWAAFAAFGGHAAF
jgi:CHAT domain-containing protein/tetratricopeptide (TPR) repeat protein